MDPIKRRKWHARFAVDVMREDSEPYEDIPASSKTTIVVYGPNAFVLSEFNESGKYVDRLPLDRIEEVISNYMEKVK